jgi:hypothetical protein
MKKLAVLLIVFGLSLSIFGIYVIYIDIHQFWESLYIGIMITLLGLIIISALKSSKTPEPLKALFVLLTFILSVGLASSLIILRSTINANHNQILTKRIQENSLINNEIGGFNRIVIRYPSKGSGRRRIRKKVRSNVYLIKGNDKYAKIRTYEVKNGNSGYVLDTLIRVHSLNPDDISFETSKAVENRIFGEKK